MELTGKNPLLFQHADHRNQCSSSGFGEREGILRAAVIGYGHFGRYHSQKYASSHGALLTAIVDPSQDRRHLALETHPSVLVFADIDAMLAEMTPDIASVVVPATRHYDISRRLLENGVHLLLEKPLTSSADDARKLAQIARFRSLVLQPGYLERFHAPFIELQLAIPEPSYFEARRLTPWSGRGTDVSVIMDLMTHDIDLALQLVGEEVVNIQARGKRTVSQHWDFVDARLEFSGGCVARLLASRIGPRDQRFCIFSKSAYAVFDGNDRTLRQSRIGDDGISNEIRYCPGSDLLAAEIDHFIQVVHGRQSPEMTASDGCVVLELAQRINAAAISQEFRLPLPDLWQIGGRIFVQ
ncbi:MAG: Gfo/Idh/MocA family oxidoreductase [Pseudohongiellaceae bacterium]